MQKFFFSLIAIGSVALYKITSVLAISDRDIGFGRAGKLPEWSILASDGNTTFVNILSLVQSFLLRVVVPVIVVGAALYIAYELFTADGDESKMKKAWKSVQYTAIALIAIAVSYAFVSIVSRLSI